MFLQIPDITPALTDSIPSVREEVSMLSSLPVDDLIQRLVSSVVSFAINLGIAILVFYLGKFIIGKIYRFISNIFVHRNLDRSLATFVLSMVRIVLYFILIVTVIGILGVETSSFIAIFASAGVAIGMALSGTLQNFAGGVLILLLKPYKIGDYIEAQGYAGTVREIQIFHTIISTGDNKIIIIPNGGLSTGSINNWSKEEYRRIEWTVGISYGDSVDAAREALMKIFASDNRIVTKFIDDHRAALALKAENDKIEAGEIPSETPEAPARRGLFGFLQRRREKALKKANAPLPTPSQILNSKPADCSPAVRVAELADSSVNLKVTVWARTSDYWDVFFSINERIYNELPAAGINFPFPQMDVHINHNS